MSRRKLTICFHDFVSVNTGLSFWELLKRGNLRLGDIDLRAQNNFHAQSSSIIYRHEIFLVRTDTAILNDDLNQWIIGEGYRPPGMHHLLAVAHDFSNLQRKFVIHDLKDTAQDPQSGDLIIAYLGGDANKRMLGIKQIDPKTYFWRGFHTFLVVRS